MKDSILVKSRECSEENKRHSFCGLLKERRKEDKRSRWDEGDFYKPNRRKDAWMVLMEPVNQEQFSISSRHWFFSTPHSFYSDK